MVLLPQEFNYSSFTFRTLKESASSFPPEFASFRILPSLISALEYGGASAATILPLVLQFGANISPDDYPTLILSPLIKLYANPDRGTRMALLDHLEEYAEKLDRKSVVEKIWPNLVCYQCITRFQFLTLNSKLDSQIQSLRYVKQQYEQLLCLLQM